MAHWLSALLQVRGLLGKRAWSPAQSASAWVDGMLDGMLSMKHRTTFSLDENTVTRMKHLANIDEVGHGIAVAFVATVYGVALSNIFFLPVANKIKARAHEETERRELILEGVVSIVEGLNPKLIRTKLEIYARHESAKKSVPVAEVLAAEKAAA